MQDRNNNIHILCAADDNYLPYAGVMLTSMFENHKEQKVHAWIFMDKMPADEHVARFNALQLRYNAEVHFVVVDDKVFKNYDIKGSNYWTTATYYRIYAPTFLPQEVKLVLYLDCDIVVNGNISELFEKDWTGISAGVVSDIFVNLDWFNIYERLDYPKELGYFNAGMILINLDYWRQHNIQQQCIDYLSHHYDKIYANDQDVLNHVLCNSKLTLPVSYNMQVSFLRSDMFKSFPVDMQADILATKKDPKVIHYAFPIKPWMIRYYIFPYNKEWHKYKRLSLWKDMRDKMPTGDKKLNYIVKRYLFWPFGLFRRISYIKP